MRRISRKLNSRSGVALIIVLLLTAILIMIGSILAGQYQNQRKTERAFYEQVEKDTAYRVEKEISAGAEAEKTS
mgnify:CR=1 FL=1